MNQNIFIIVSLSLILFSCKKGNEGIEEQGNIEGNIYNEFNQPIIGALIELDDLSRSSDSIGGYIFSDIAAKEYTVSVSKEPYLSMEKKVFVEGGKTVSLNFILETEGAFLQFSDTALYFNSLSGESSFQIGSNTNWSIESYPEWVALSALEGQGNLALEITYSENSENFSRTDTIIAKGGGITQKLVIIQYPELRMISFEGIHGNETLDIVDSVYVLFNRPITVESIIAMPNYVHPISYEYTDNNHGIKFDFIAAEMGYEYPFTISVSDESGVVLEEEIIVPYYNRKIDIEGEITDYLYVNQDKEMLIAVFNPSKLIHYSIELDSILYTYDLSPYLSPIQLSYNPFNSLIYMMGSYPNGEMNSTPIDRPVVYTLSMLTNEIVLAKTIEPDEDDHPEFPAIYPINIGFTKDGLGIILLGSTSSSEKKLKFIDSANNDSIYSYPDDKHESLWFIDVQMNYDYSKLYFLQESGGEEYGIFDVSTQRITFLDQGSNVNSSFITANRKKETFYAGQYGYQYILDLNNNKSEKTNLSGGPGDISADFSYISDKEEFVYFINGREFFVVDYSAGIVVRKCNTTDYLEQLSTTINGQYIITIDNNEDSSSIIIFDSNSLF
ncbi:hypothetical protein [Lentimicrobium sp. S6]|uniref:BACON domain-containing protein n=1 Tax=Lentimicrobium sp. S6 TaxID=2735872 RepID=UPI001552298A|nr:hypothetical protein [Lentimicrobium sp. S6]NPD47903.1 hypothetical protein [Lentimicrobium sp. S6]